MTLDQSIKIVFIGLFICLIAISPLMISFTTYSTRWEDPEHPTLIEGLFSYSRNISDEVSAQSITQLVFITGFCIVAFGYGIYYKEKKEKNGGLR